MKSIFTHLFPAVFIASVLSMGVCYIFLYRWSENSFSEAEITLSLFMTVPIFFITTSLIFYFFVKRYAIITKDKYKWWEIFLFLFITTVLCSYLVDGIYHQIDEYLFQAYSKDVIDLLSRDEKDGTDEFEKASFFMQTIFQNVIGILFGSLIGIISLNKRYEN